MSNKTPEHSTASPSCTDAATAPVALAARTAELHRLWQQTRALRQWRNEFSTVLEQHRKRPLWRTLTELIRFKDMFVLGRDEGRLAYLKYVGTALTGTPPATRRSYNPLDDFQPPPLESPPAAALADARPPEVWASVARGLEAGRGDVLVARRPRSSASGTLNTPPTAGFDCMPLTLGTAVAIDAAPQFIVGDGLLDFLRNPLPVLRQELARLAPEGRLVLIAYAAEPACPAQPTTLPHLLLDESEADRRESDLAHIREWLAAQTPSAETATAPSPEALLDGDAALRFHSADPALLRTLAHELERTEGARFVGLTTCVAENRLAYVLTVLKSTVSPALELPESAAAAEPQSENAPEPATLPPAPVQTTDAPRTLLTLLHADPFRVQAGGTERHVLERIAALKLPRVVLAYPAGCNRIDAALVYNGDIGSAVIHHFPLRTLLPTHTEFHAEAEDLVLWIARLFEASAVCIDHLMGWPLALTERLRAAQLPYMVVLHDFFAICPSLNLIRVTTGERCAAHDRVPKPGACNACLNDFFLAYGVVTEQRGAALLATHQQRWRTILQHARAVVVPSAATRDRIAAVHSTALPSWHVLPHGTPLAQLTPVVQDADALPLRVALLGQLTARIKGAELLQELWWQTRKLPIEWHAFGAVDGSTFPKDGIARLVEHGPYAREQIATLLRESRAQLAVFTSIVEETFSLTLSEAWCAGLPALVPDLGALGERVKSSGLGWVYSPGSATDAANQLRDLLPQPHELARVQQRFMGFKQPSVAENATAYRKLLEPLLSEVSTRARSDAGFYLAQARAYHERLAAEFDSSEPVFTLPNRTDVPAANQIRLAAEAGGLRAQPTGNDAWLQLPTIAFRPFRRHILKLDVAETARQTLRLFFQTAALPCWSQSQTALAEVHGRETVWFELPADANGPLRLDLGSMLIRTLEVRAVHET